MENMPVWLTPIIAASLALAIAIAAHLFVIAPYRALRMLSPFYPTVSYGYLPSAYPKQSFEQQKVAIRIKNRAYLPKTCVVHVVSVDGFDNVHHAFPRLIQETTIEPGDTVDVPIAAWTFRGESNPSDANITFCGSVGWGWGGNFVSIPATVAHTMTVRVGVQNGLSTEMRIRVWIDGNSLIASEQGSAM